MGTRRCSQNSAGPARPRPRGDVVTLLDPQTSLRHDPVLDRRDALSVPDAHKAGDPDGPQRARRHHAACDDGTSRPSAARRSAGKTGSSARDLVVLQPAIGAAVGLADDRGSNLTDVPSDTAVRPVAHHCTEFERSFTQSAWAHTYHLGTRGLFPVAVRQPEEKEIESWKSPDCPPQDFGGGDRFR